MSDARCVGRRVVALVAAGLLTAITAPASPCAAEEADEPVDSAPRCHEREDRACTLVRETEDGVWVWTQRFRATESTGPPWSISLGPGGLIAGGPVRIVASSSNAGERSTFDDPTPNGAPILE
jgi:hypothetical protein